MVRKVAPRRWQAGVVERGTFEAPEKITHGHVFRTQWEAAQEARAMVEAFRQS
jgi:hypothetical protein